MRVCGWLVLGVALAQGGDSSCFFEYCMCGA